MPDDGTAGNGQGNEGIFDNYLAGIEDAAARSAVEGYLKDAERHVNTRLQDASALEKQFGSYREVDLSGYTPDQLTGVLSWYNELTSSPDTFKQWLTDTAREQGILGADESVSDTDIDVPSTKAELDAYVAQAVSSALAPIQEQQQSLQQETSLQALERQIASGFNDLETEHGIKLTDEDKQTIIDLGEAVEGQDWIAEGFKRLQTIQGEAATRFVQDRAKQPAPALRPGGQEAPQKVTDWKEAERMASERLRQAFGH